MSLKDLKESLYQRGEDSTQKETKIFLPKEMPGTEQGRPFEPTFFKMPTEDKSADWIKEDEEKRKKIKKIKKIALVSGLSIVTLAFLAWGFLYLSKKAFSETKVTVSISGPEKVNSGEPATIAIRYKNDNWVDLKDAVLYINYAENFKPENNLNLTANGPNSSRMNIGTVKSGTAGELDITGKFFGTENFLTYVEAKLVYSSSNFSSQFQIQNKMAVMITSSPLSLEIVGPKSVPTGGAVTYQVNYRNNGGDVFKDLRLQADYPQGFSFSSSEPLPAAGNNSWFIGDLGAGQSGSVKISGSLSGAVNDFQRFKFSIGEIGSQNEFVSYNETESSTGIVGSPIVIKQTINGKEGDAVVNAGDVLIFHIAFVNTGSVPLTNVVLTENIKSPILNYGKYNAQNPKGNLDSANGKVSWNASQLEILRVLTPGAGGEVSFSIPVLDIIPVKNLKDKNFSFQAVASMDSPDIPTPEGANKVIASNGISVKLNSKLTMKLTGFYNDSDIPNSGPLPLKVGQETTFTMRLGVGNVSNDITGAKVVMTLAPGAKWKGNFLPKSENVSYNDRTNEATWDIGNMPAGLGILTDKRELVFQIGVVPSQAQIGDFVPLIKKTVFSANDVFTNQNLNASLDEKTSSLPEDISVGDGGKVAQ